MANVEFLELPDVAPGSLVLVVVRELHAWLDVLQGVDPDAIVLYDGFAVGIARVVDESRGGCLP